jgi:hypothetical protein
MALYDKQWFVNMITFLRKWKWFDSYIYGKSQNMEDFCRNPMEVLRDNCFPFVIENVKPYSFLLRVFFIPYQSVLADDYQREVLAKYPNIDSEIAKGPYRKIYQNGERTLGFDVKKYRIIDLGVSRWYTKYPNAGFMLQISLSLKWSVIPILWAGMVIRHKADRYFQFGLGWAPQRKNYDGSHPGDTSMTAVMSGKFRLAGYEKELEWNPAGEIFGWYEGNC